MFDFQTSFYLFSVKKDSSNIFFLDAVALGSYLAFDMLYVLSKLECNFSELRCHILLVKKRLKKPNKLLVTISVECAICNDKEIIFLYYGRSSVVQPSYGQVKRQ